MTGGGVTRPSGREVVFSRVIAAPVELVWEMWSDVRHLHEWFGPAGYTTSTDEFAFTPGGVWRFTMHGPDGNDCPNRLVFRTIEPNARIVYENRWDRPGAPLEFLAEVTLSAEGTGTRLTLHMTFADDRAMQTAVEQYGVVSGGTETFDRLGRYLDASPASRGASTSPVR